jgi:prepilin-type N-terminal cleavage/methylation domain-containing protein
MVRNIIELGKMRKGQNGFTLIELITIIVVLGILTAIAVTRFQDLTQDANVSATKGNLGTVRGGINLLHAKILLVGVSAGNPEWPTVAELNNNALDAATRPAQLANLKIIEGPSGAVCGSACLPEDLVSTQAALAARKTVMTATTVQADSRTPPGGAGGWAYDSASGQFYVNQATPNDSKGIPASQW